MADNAEEPDLSLGYVAVRLGYITPEQLERAIEEQKKGKEPIGEVLVHMNLLDRAQLDRILLIQKGGVMQVMEKERKTLYVCPSCAMRFKIVEADESKKYICKYCRIPVLPVKNPQSLQKAGTEELEFTDESKMSDE